MKSQGEWIASSKAGKHSSYVTCVKVTAPLADPCHASCGGCALVMQTALRAPSRAEGPLSPCAESHNLLTCILSPCLDKSAASCALTQFRQRCTAANDKAEEFLEQDFKMLTIFEVPENAIALIHRVGTDL